jgi:hypothetical protein
VPLCQATEAKIWSLGHSPILIQRIARGAVATVGIASLANDAAPFLLLLHYQPGIRYRTPRVYPPRGNDWFHKPAGCRMLAGCLILAADGPDAPGSGFRPTTSWTTLPDGNVVQAGRPGMLTCQTGWSPMIEPIAFRSRTPKRTSSRHDAGTSRPAPFDVVAVDSFIDGSQTNPDRITLPP